jgi:hypothetical protein
LTSERERVLRWKLVKLQEKLQAASEKKESLSYALKEEIPDSQTPKEDHHAPVEGTRGRGRGMRGRGGRGRMVPHPTMEQQETPIDFRASLQNFREAKVALKVARKSGNAEAILVAEEALKTAMETKKSSLAVALATQRERKRDCTIKLKEAQRSGNEEQVKICEEALAQAFSELKQAKSELFQ